MTVFTQNSGDNDILTLIIKFTMQNQLFPPEVLENTAEAYLPHVSVKSQLIYTTFILTILAGLAASPFIYVDISVQSLGLIRTVSEKTELRPMVSGKIQSIKVAENQSIKSGESLIQLSSEDLDTKIRLNQFQQAEKRQFIADLRQLIQIEHSNLFGDYTTNTPLYTQQLNTFRATIQENQFFQKKVKKELDTDRYLYKEKVLTMREIDSKEYDYTKLKAEYETTFNRQLSQWQADLNQYGIELSQLMSENRQLQEQKSLYTIKAPVGGTIQQMAGRYEGSYLQAGETLGIISPDSSLLAEVYISPQDIGFIKKAMPVNIQMDAFNYNEWGMIKAQVLDISNDVTVLQERPVFKVKCSLSKTSLKLKNGYTAYLKKGMSLRARFIITRRSLYQLLYDNVDDWLNPKTL
jgi:HlyD family secretion protein